MNGNGYDKVMAARSVSRATSSDFINNIFSDFCEMHGDRRYADDSAVICGIAMLDDVPCTVAGLEKGHDTKEKIRRNFGAAHPEGYRKALRQMKLAEKFGRPVICFIDTSGAYCGIEAEQRGQGQAIADNLAEMASLKTPIITIVIGEGGSGGALALSVADEIWMLENAYYSVVSPEGCASILWKDPDRAPEAANCLKLTADDLIKLGVADKIFEENVKQAKLYGRIKTDLISAVGRLRKLDTAELLSNRYAKYRKMGEIR